MGIPKLKAAEKEEERGYASHAPPLLEENGEVPVMRIPGEEGYFPTGTNDEGLVSCEAKLFQIHPKYGKQGKPIASGELILQDPHAGTADEVELVGLCDGISFFVKSGDAATKVSPTDFVLMFPDDCIGLDLEDAAPADVLRVEGLLAARMKFHDESMMSSGKSENDDLVPDDGACRSMYRMSKWMAAGIVKSSEMGAKKIEAHGEKKRSSITEMQEKQVSKSTIKAAKNLRSVSEKTNAVATKLSDKLSEKVGSSVGKHAVPKGSDSKMKTKARQVLLTLSLAHSEVSDGAREGYNIMTQAAKEETTSFVAAKYGAEAAELARHTTGAVANFGSAALTARRIVNVKKVVKSGVKQMAMQEVKAWVRA